MLPETLFGDHRAPGDAAGLELMGMEQVGVMLFMGTLQSFGNRESLLLWNHTTGVTVEPHNR